MRAARRYLRTIVDDFQPVRSQIHCSVRSFATATVVNVARKLGGASPIRRAGAHLERLEVGA